MEKEKKEKNIIMMEIYYMKENIYTIKGMDKEKNMDLIPF